jgi:ABC-type transport system involved in multi-copper enzyme maturation permease subunit
MVWTIAKKEFHDNLLTFRFSFGTIILILLVSAITLVNIKNYTELRNEYQSALRKTEQNLKETRVYCQLRYTALKPPETLSVLNLGVTQRLGNSVHITLREVPSIAKKFTEENPLLSVFPSLDLTLVYKIVISLLALLFGFDAICGEKEKGTLKIILSQKVSRFKVIFGKYLGRLLTLATILMISLVMGFLILVAHFASLTLMDWLRLALFGLFTLLYISEFLILGFLISALTKKGSSSLLFSLIVWVALVIILPNLATYLATVMKPTPPEKTVDVQAEEISRQTDKAIGAWQEAHPQNIVLGGMMGPDEWAIENADQSTIDYFKRLISYSEPLLRKKADDIWNVKQDYYRVLKKQEKLASFLAGWLPAGLYEEATELVSKTDLANYEKFIQQSILYRESIFQYLQSKDAYHSLRYFTVMEEKDILPYEEYMKKVWGRKKPDGGYYGIDDHPPLQLDDFPRFECQQESLAVFLPRTFVFLLAFVVFSLALFIGSAIAFNFYDVR